MGSEVLDSRYSWLRLAYTLAIAMVGNVGMWAIIVIMPAVQSDFSIARADASLPYTLTMVGFALGSLFIGRVVDKFGVTKALISAAITISVSFAMAATSDSVLTLSILQFVVGFGTAASFGPLIADISHWFYKRRGIAVAIAASGNYLSGAIWPILLSGILADYGWRTIYIVLAVLTMVLMVPLSLLLRPSVPEAATAHADNLSRSNARSVNFSPRTLILLLALAGIGCCVAMSMPQVHIVSYCVDLGYGPAIGAEMLSIMLLGGVVSRLVSGLVADKSAGHDPAYRINSAMHRFVPLPAFQWHGFPLCGQYGFWIGTRRDRSELRNHCPRIFACERSGRTRRFCNYGHYRWYGDRRMDVWLDLRSDRILPNSLPKRNRLELP